MCSDWNDLKSALYSITVDMDGTYWLGDEKIPPIEYGLFVERACANQRSSNYRLERKLDRLLHMGK